MTTTQHCMLDQIENNYQNGIKEIKGDDIREFCTIKRNRTTRDWYDDLNKISEEIRIDNEKSLRDWNDSKTNILSQNREIKSAENLTSEELRKRIADCKNVQNDIVSGVQNIIEQIDKNAILKKRSESLCNIMEIPANINSDMFKILKTRVESENVDDDLLFKLLQEKECIIESRNLIDRAIQNLIRQNDANHELKNKLEKDYSSNLYAIELDRMAEALTVGDANKQYYEHYKKTLSDYLTLEEWQDRVNRNIKLAPSYTKNSEDLRVEIENLINDIARNLKKCSEQVDVAIGARMNEMNNAKLSLETSLEQVMNEIRNQELNVTYLKNTMRNKSDPIKLVQTRFHIREKRYGNDLVDDNANKQMLTEADLLQDVVISLKDELKKAQDNLKKLRDDQVRLEEEIEFKKQTFFKIKSQILPQRANYPTQRRILGEDYE